MLQQTIGRLTLQKGLLAGDKCLDYTYLVQKSPRVNPEDAQVPLLEIKSKTIKVGMLGNYISALEDTFMAEIVDLHTYNPLSFIDIERHRILELDGLQYNYLSRLDSTPKQKPLYLLRPLNNEFTYAVIADYCKGSITPSLVAQIKEEIPEVYVDTKSPDPRAYAGCIIKLNDTEFEQTKEFHSLFKLIVHTRGQNGARLIYPNDRTKDYEVSGLPGGPVNVSGAGDVFFSYFIGARQILGYTDYEALVLANKAAHQSTLYATTHLPELHELR